MVSSLISEDVEYCPQQVALNPTKMFKLSFEILQVTLSMSDVRELSSEVPFPNAHPPGIVSAYFKSPNSLLQLIKVANNKLIISIFFIGLGNILN